VCGYFSPFPQKTCQIRLPASFLFPAFCGEEEDDTIRNANVAFRMLSFFEPAPLLLAISTLARSRYSHWEVLIFRKAGVEIERADCPFNEEDHCIPSAPRRSMEGNSSSGFFP